ncbi:MAG: hypothetical protein JXR73_12880 [Candidatus Omnitrophica bacterium]|nr:hypothetical protein [Candidatus Omnitrophota bacterium]
MKTNYFMLLLLPLFLTASVSISAQDDRPSIHASDVVFMYAADPATQYDDYQGTVVGWGGRPRSRAPRDVDRFKQRVEEAHKRGMRYCGSVDFLVDFAGFIDYAPDDFMEAVCRDLEGAPLQVPWLWDHKHKGHPAYWFCFNHPTYQKYLLDQAERVCLAPVDGLHIDDYSGTSHCSEFNGGCFCPYCMEGFRGYLQKKYSDQELLDLGISSIQSFDYGQHLKNKGFTPDDFKRYRKEDPLRKHFQDFQNEQMKTRISAVYSHAENLRGKPLVRSVNSSASSPRTVIPSPIIDYFCGEIPQHASRQTVGAEPVFVYKMVEALGDRQTATASGHDWAWIKANEKPGLVRAWIAQTYAHGSVFMAPHRQWCYTQELGTHWWSGKPQDFAFLYRFVRANAHLLDEYISLSNLAALCANSDFNAMKQCSTALTDANIPHDLLYTPEANLAPKNAPLENKYQAVLVSSNAKSQADWLKDSGVQIIEWDGLPSIPQAFQQWIVTNKPDYVRVSLRYKPEQPDAPLVCHVLNQNYQPDADSIAPGDITVAIAQPLLSHGGKSQISRAIIHEPNKESRTVDVQSSDSAVSFSIDQIGLWAIVELQ